MPLKIIVRKYLKLPLHTALSPKHSSIVLSSAADRSNASCQLGRRLADPISFASSSKLNPFDGSSATPLSHDVTHNAHATTSLKRVNFDANRAVLVVRPFGLKSEAVKGIREVMTYDAGNIFAKILRGDADAFIVEQDEYSLTMMDIMPQTTGHTLVIPKEPATDIFEISDSYLQKVIIQTRRVARAVDQAFNPDGVMILQLNRAGAGQSVFHLHFHVIPRWGGLQMKFHAREIEESAILQEHAKKIRSELELI